MYTGYKLIFTPLPMDNPVFVEKSIISIHSKVVKKKKTVHALICTAFQVSDRCVIKTYPSWDFPLNDLWIRSHNAMRGINKQAWAQLPLRFTIQTKHPSLLWREKKTFLIVIFQLLIAYSFIINCIDLTMSVICRCVAVLIKIQILNQ